MQKYSVIEGYRVGNETRIKCGGGWEVRVEGNTERKTKGLLRSHMRTYYCRSFLKYIHVFKKFKWMFSIM